jgi:hypothetical protein
MQLKLELELGQLYCGRIGCIPKRKLHRLQVSGHGKAVDTGKIIIIFICAPTFWSAFNLSPLHKMQFELLVAQVEHLFRQEGQF